MPSSTSSNARLTGWLVRPSAKARCDGDRRLRDRLAQTAERALATLGRGQDPRQDAIMLERLVVRDGWTRADATEAILVSSAGALRRDAVEAIADALRLQPRPHTVRLQGHTGMSAARRSAQSPETHAIASDARGALTKALDAALRDCSRVDQLILALKFARGLPMPDIEARLGMAAGYPQKRYERLRRKLLARLKAQGCSLEDVNAALEAPDPESGLLDRLLENAPPGAERERERLTRVRRYLHGCSRAQRSQWSTKPPARLIPCSR